MKSIPFLLSIHFSSNQITLSYILLDFILWETQNKELCNGWVCKAEERRRERENSCGDMISEIRNKASTWVIRTR